MCQGSTCHVVAQHGDISKLNKALLLTWEVCATIAIKTSKKDFATLFQKTQGKEGKPRKATFVTQRFLGHNCWLPRCVDVRVPRYMPRQPLGILTQVPCQGQRACLLAQHVLSTGWTCATIAIMTSKEITMLCSKKGKANKGKPRKATFVAQRFLGHNCLRQRRCVRGQRVMLSHSMEISASLTKLFCWLGKSVQPLPSRHPKRFRNAVPKSTRQTKANQQRQLLWHKDSWDTTVWDNADVSGVNVSCCRTAWRYQQA